VGDALGLAASELLATAGGLADVEFVDVGTSALLDWVGVAPPVVASTWFEPTALDGVVVLLVVTVVPWFKLGPVLVNGGLVATFTAESAASSRMFALRMMGPVNSN